MVTYFFVPDKTGVDLADDDEDFMNYLAANGWEGTVGEDGDEIALGSDTMVISTKSVEEDLKT